MELITISGKQYVLNIAKICDYISKMTDKKVKESEILDNFSFKNDIKSLEGKTIRELTTTGNGQDPIVYDLIKIILVQVIAYDDTDDRPLTELPFGTKIAFNTLLSEGFLIEKI